MLRGYKILKSETAPSLFRILQARGFRPAVSHRIAANSSTWPVAGGAMQNLAQASIIRRRFSNKSPIR